MTVSVDYSADQRAAWRLLYRRQVAALQGRAHPTWFAGLSAFGFDEEIPELETLSRRIEDLVGWRVVTADGQLDGLAFNTLLRDHALPATTYVRGLDELGHSKEPDMFHDMFGHLPWLIDPDYRAFLAEFGAASLQLMSDPVANGRLGLAFKWSIEYGLISYADPNGTPTESSRQIRACGAGLMSSATELAHALGDDVARLPFTPAATEATYHAPAQLQPQYFVIESFASLRSQLPELVAVATGSGSSS